MHTSITKFHGAPPHPLIPSSDLIIHYTCTCVSHFGMTLVTSGEFYNSRYHHLKFFKSLLLETRIDKKPIYRTELIIYTVTHQCQVKDKSNDKT